MIEKREEMLLQRSLWENRVQADIDLIQRAERERDLRAKLVINSFHSAKAHVSVSMLPIDKNMILIPRRRETNNVLLSCSRVTCRTLS